jgi:molecular chaperone GrpE
MAEQDEEAEPMESTPLTNGEVFPSASAHPRQVTLTDEELKGMQKELVEYKDKYLRLLADAENARKRLQKERQELTRYAIESLIIDFLKPLDNFENALRFAQDMSDEVKNWAYGFQMILAQFKDALSQHGIVAVDSLGKPFDPHEHEAVEMVETEEEPPGTIIEECMRGYRLGDRTIRAARVKVAKETATD